MKKIKRLLPYLIGVMPLITIVSVVAADILHTAYPLNTLCYLFYCFSRFVLISSLGCFIIAVLSLVYLVLLCDLHMESVENIKKDTRM